MTKRIAAAIALAFPLVLAAHVAGATPASAAEVELPDPVETALRKLIPVPKQRVAFRDGRIVTADAESLADNSVSAAAGMIVSLPFSSFADRFCRADRLFAHASIAQQKRLSLPLSPAELTGVWFTAADRDEIERFLNAEPGDELNLSQAEIERLRDELAGVEDATDPQAAQAVSRAYRLLLMLRLRAFAEGGVAAIAPYARGGGATASPARELMADLASVAPLLRRYDPQLASGGDAARTSYWWIKRTLQDRPLYVLVQQIADRRDAVCVMVQRHFYVGHSYNTSQAVTLMLPAGDGRTAVFTLNSTATDQVAGVLGALAKPVARSRLRQSLRDGFAKLRGRAVDG